MRDDFEDQFHKMQRRGELMSHFVTAWIALSGVLIIGGLVGLAYVALHPELIGQYIGRIFASA